MMKLIREIEQIRSSLYEKNHPACARPRQKGVFHFVKTNLKTLIRAYNLIIDNKTRSLDILLDVRSSQSKQLLFVYFDYS